MERALPEAISRRKSKTATETQFEAHISSERSCSNNKAARPSRSNPASSESNSKAKMPTCDQLDYAANLMTHSANKSCSSEQQVAVRAGNGQRLHD
jgi:hypothetical protein